MILKAAHDWLFSAAVDRHDDAARWLDYLADSTKTWYALFVVCAGLISACGAWGASFILGCVLLFRWLKVPLTSVIVAVWETNVWLAGLVITLALADLVLGPGSLGAVVKEAVRLVVYLIIQYLVVDLMRPPRDRKKIRVRVLSRLPPLVTQR